MSNMIRWEPMRQMMSMRDVMDNMLQEFYDRPFGLREMGFPTMDLVQTEEDVIIKATLPGIKPDDLEITFTDNTLTIKGQTQEDQEVKEANYHLRERRFGSFARSVSLGSHINVEKIQANYDSGVLTLTLPKAEEVKPKRIAIKSAKMIEGKVK